MLVKYIVTAITIYFTSKNIRFGIKKHIIIVSSTSTLIFFTNLFCRYISLLFITCTTHHHDVWYTFILLNNLKLKPNWLLHLKTV